MTAHISRKERIARITTLVDALADVANYRIPAEVLRAARLVPGWSLKRGTPGLFEVDCPGRPGLHLNRDDTLALLRSRWLPAARAELGAMEPDVTDGITEAAKLDESTPTLPHDLDPGIRDLVAELNRCGFVTTDSGDGESKQRTGVAADGLIDAPHIVIDPFSPRLIGLPRDDAADLILGTIRRFVDVEARDHWRVEVTYSTADRSWTAIAIAEAPVAP